MRKHLTFIVLVFLAVSAGAQEYPAQAPLNPEFKEYLKKKADGKGVQPTSNGYMLGWLPAPVKPVVKPVKATKSKAFPASYDLRDQSVLTSVRDQGQCGSCWAFATMGVVESYWLKAGAGTYDLSEDNLKGCHNFDWGHCDGGNYHISAALLTRGHGPMTEAEDSYSADADSSCPSGLTPAGYVPDVWWIDTSRASIKQAVTDYGAVYISYYSHGDSYNNTNNTYFYEGTGDGSDGGGDHGVVLVGWDDDKVTDADKPGAWIIKNSWGDSWGESGYFYMSYYDSVGIKRAGFMPNRMDYDPKATIHGHAEMGWVSELGYQDDGKDLAFVKFIPSSDQQIQSIGTYAIASEATLDIEVYDDFDGSSLSNLLGSLSGQSCTYSGYHTFELSSPIEVTSGNDVYVKVAYNTSTDFPIPVEMVKSGYSSNAVIADSGACWVSSDGTNWLALGNGITDLEYDVCIKAYATESSGSGTGSGGSSTSPFSWLNPEPQGSGLLDYHFFDASNGFVCGADGALLNTTDGGATWSVNPIDTLEWMNSIQFVDAVTGYMAGGDGLVYKTTDGGANWSLASRPTSSMIYGIYFPDASNGFAVTHNGDILQTTNGASDWSSLTYDGSGSRLNEVYFATSSLGFAVGYDIVRTADGGSTWDTIACPVEKELKDVWFTDSNTGYIVGSYGVILKTTDGGLTWSLYDMSGPNFSSYNSDAIYNEFESVYFTDADTGYAAGEYAIYKTTDAGSTWTKKHHDSDIALKSIYFTSSSNGLAFGDNGVILESSDGGETWSNVYDSEISRMYGVDFVNSTTGWTVSYDGYIQKTTDGGNSWLQQNTNNYLYDVEAIDENTMITVGTTGRIMATADGGSSWASPSSGVSGRLYAIEVIDQTTLMAGGENGDLTKSSDGGLNWTAFTISGLADDIREILFTTPDTGFVFGGSYSSGVIFKTTDGGGSWTEITSPVQEEIMATWFVDDTIGYACGADETILKTIDGGDNWTAQTLTVPSGYYTPDFNDILFVDENTGYLVGDNGIFFKTSDGGQTWEYVEGITSNYLHDAAFAGSNLIISGDKGTILKYETGLAPALAADFSATPTSGDAPLTVSFTDQSSGSVTSWQWDFNNDGTVDSTNQNPTWEYSQAGTYTVSLTVGDGSSTATETKTDYITVNQAGSGIISTTEGGNWSETTTWVGGVVPTASDNVIIDGVVSLDDNFSCNDLTVNEEDTLQDNANYYRTLTVNGSITNNGVIRDNPAAGYDLTVKVAGDVTNNGIWKNDLTESTGGSDQTITMGIGASFEKGRWEDTDSTSALLAGSSLTFSNGIVVDLEDDSYREGHLVLPAGSGYNLTLDSASTEHLWVSGNNNELHVYNHGYLDAYTHVRDIVLKGKVNIDGSSNLYFEGNSVILEDTLQNRGDYYETVIINGSFENNGVIRDNPEGYDLTIETKGDVTNNGVWKNDLTESTGSSDQTIRMRSGASFELGRWEDTDSTSALVAGSPLTFSKGFVLDLEDDSYREGHLVLPAGSGFSLTLDSASTEHLWVSGNNNQLHVYNHGYLDAYTHVRDIVLKGKVNIDGSSNVYFEGNSVILEDTLQNRGDYYETVIINGSFENNGVIRDNPEGYDLTIETKGDITNNGIWKNDLTESTGSSDQTIAMGVGASFELGRWEDTDSTSALVAGSSLTFSKGFVLDLQDNSYQKGHLVLPVGSGYNLTLDSASTEYLWLIGNGNELHVSSHGYLDGYTHVQDVTLKGQVNIDGNSNVYFEGNSVVLEDTLQNQGDYYETLIIKGSFTNNGVIRDNPEGYDMTVEVNGDLANNGLWQNSDTYMKGTADQTINLVDARSVGGTVRFYAMKGTGSYQWYLDDSEVSGETSEYLSFDVLDITDYGTYYSSTDVGNSRNIVVTGNVDIAARFIASDTSGVAPLSVSFTDQSEGNIQSWSWDFDGDGTEDATEQNPTWEYTKAGTYDVSLTVSDGSSTDTQTKNGYINVIDKLGYGWNVYAASGDNLVGPVAVGTSGKLVNLSEDAGDFIAGADWAGNKWYGAQYNTNALVTIDTTTGVLNTIGTMSLNSATGLAYDITTGKMYVSSHNGTGSYLYEVDLSDGSVTSVGEILASEVIIGIACDTSGQLFGISLSDNLYTIDKATGAGSAVGSLGITINYAQDIAYDRKNDVLYGALYESSKSEEQVTVSKAATKAGGGLYTIDASSGSATLVGQFIDQVSGFAIPHNFEYTLSAGFTANVTSGTVPLTVSFTDQSEGNIQSWSWDFDGDGTEDASTQNPEFTYDQAGTYSVTLTVSDGSGSDELIRTDYITVNEAINCTWDFASEAYVMNFESSDDMRGWTNYDANSDDSKWSIYSTTGVNETQAAGYEFSSINSADDWLYSRCFDLEAGKEYAISFYYAAGMSSFPEKLKLAYGTDNAPSAMNTVINDLGTIDNESYMKSKDTIAIGTTDTYYFGWYAYSDADMFYLYIDSVKIEEVISEPLNADFSADELAGYAPHTVQFTDQSTGDIVSWSWDFNNDGTEDAASQNPNYTFNEAGTYTVTLSVYDGSTTVTETKTGYIEVYTPVTADFSSDVTSGNVPLMVSFSDQSEGDITSWEWDFDDDGTTDATEQNPSYTYNQVGTYTVSLVVSDGTQSSTTSKTGLITVEEEITALEGIHVQEDLVIYPNPASNKATISFGDAAQVKRIELTSLEGNKLAEWNESHMTQDRLPVDVSQYPDGVYLIRAYMKEQVVTVKLIIK